jgi:DNA-binding MarR family transcriptional regulator
MTVALSSEQQRHEVLHRTPGHLIRRLQQIAVSVFLDETDSHATTPVQYATLYAIGAHPGIDQTRLAGLVALDRSTIGDVIDRLQRRSLVERCTDPGDRRAKVVFLTPGGQALIEAMEPKVDQAQDIILAPLSPGEREGFLTLLGKLVDVNNTRSRSPLGGG